MDKKAPRFAVYLLVICLLGVALTGICLQQHLKIKTLDAKIESQGKAIAQQLEELSEVRKNSENLVQQKTWLVQESASLREKNHTLRAEIANNQAAASDANPTPSPQATKKEGGMGGMLAQMMKDPEMKEVISKQQALYLQGQTGELTKALGLTPDQGRELVDLLIQQQKEAMDHRTGELNPSPDDAAKMADRTKENQEALKNLLGDEKYAKYQDYQKSAISRHEADQLKQQLASTQTPLQDVQAQLVAKTIQEETSRGGNVWAQLKPEDYSNPEKTDAALASIVERNKRVLRSAQSYLSAPQLEALAQSQARSLEMQKMTFKMMGKMFPAK